MSIVKFVKLKEGAQVPSQGSMYAAGYDLYACLGDNQSISIEPHTTVKIGTGLAI